MNARFLSPLAALLASATMAAAATSDIPMGYVPPAWVGPAVKKVLSPQGRFVINLQAGTVRVIDTEDKIADVLKVIDQLQKAPSQVSLGLGFVTYGKKTVEHTVSSGAGDGFPFPRKYSAPKVTVLPGGGYTVIPSQPSDFQGRGSGSSAGVTRTETTTEPTKTVIRRLTASSIPEKPTNVPVLAKVEDLAGLRSLAQRLGAIKPEEPAWPAASTELLVRTELVGSEIRVTVTPQIAIPAMTAGQEARRIPLTACAAMIPITRQDATPTGKLPKTDGDFYHHFLGIPVGGPDDVTALSLSGVVRYVGAGPQ